MGGFQHSYGYVNDFRWVAYMAVDSQLPTSDSLSDGKVIDEMVASSSQSSQTGNGEDEKGEEEGASVEEEHIHPAQRLMQLTCWCITLSSVS